MVARRKLIQSLHILKLVPLVIELVLHLSQRAQELPILILHILISLDLLQVGVLLFLEPLFKMLDLGGLLVALFFLDVGHGFLQIDHRCLLFHDELRSDIRGLNQWITRLALILLNQR